MTNSPLSNAPLPNVPLEPAGPTLISKLFAIGCVLVSCAYLGNIGAGIFGEIPDVIPGLGNLDEVFFSGLLIVSLAKLGINIVPNLGGSKATPPKHLEGPGRRSGAP